MPIIRQCIMLLVFAGALANAVPSAAELHVGQQRHTVFDDDLTGGGYEDGAQKEYHGMRRKGRLRSPHQQIWKRNSMDGVALVALQEPNIRKQANDVIRRMGFRVIEATDGAGAIAVIDNGTIDLILTSMMLGPFSGIEIAVHARRMNADVKVVFVVSEFLQGMAARAYVPSSLTIDIPFCARDLERKVHSMFKRNVSLTSARRPV